MSGQVHRAVKGGLPPNFAKMVVSLLGIDFCRSLEDEAGLALLSVGSDATAVIQTASAFAVDVWAIEASASSTLLT